MPQELWPPLVVPDRPQPTPFEDDDEQTTLFPSPLFEGRLSDTSTLIASINLLLDESPEGIAAGRPAPLSAEPGPQVDYRLIACVLSVTHKSLSREDYQSLQAVDRLRRRYFSAHGVLAHLHRAIQDLWAQRQLLVDRAEQIKIKIMHNNNNNNNNDDDDDDDDEEEHYHTLLHQNAISQSLNLKQSHEALERYYRCAKGVAQITQDFFDAKVNAMPVIYSVQNEFLSVWAARVRTAVTQSNSSRSSTPTLTISTRRKRSRDEMTGGGGGGEVGGEENISPKRLC